MLRRNMLACAVVLAALVVGLVWLGNPLQSRGDVIATRSTDPRIAHAYEIAQTMPHLLEAIPCHCGCMRNRLAHTSNLDCFKSDHGESCWMCVAIAHDAEIFSKQGRSVDWIRRYVTNVYTFRTQE